MRQVKHFLTAPLISVLLLLSGCGSSYTTQDRVTTDKVKMWDVDLYYRYSKTQDSAHSTQEPTPSYQQQDVRSEKVGTGIKVSEPSTDYQGAYFWSAYDNASDDKKKIIRNKIMYELMFVIDDNYNDFEEKLRSNSAIKHAWADIISQTLTMTASIIPGGNAPRVLAAVDTGWKGSNRAFDQHILAGKMMDAIIKSMRASRDKVAAKIYGNMKNSVENYPLAAGLKDLGEYKRQGSLDTAMTFIAEEVSLKAKAADSAKARADSSLVR